jgi:1,4-dihydroxy-6-naphthoate synthase
VSGLRRLRFGFSPCPNDTFAFWAALHGVVRGGVELVPELADIEALNQRAVAARDPLPITKLSMPALAAVVADYAVLPAGAAMGFGCGPLLVCREDAPWRHASDLAGARIAIPGRHTTAFLLLSSLLPDPRRQVVPMRFDEVMAAVDARTVDAGLIIHESRFTFRDHGLRALEDLGVLWEAASGGPLPLGVIAARRDLPAATFRAAGELLRASVELARREPDRPSEFVQAHARELDAAVQEAHIALYVNDYTVDLGASGRRAIDDLLARGRALGLLPRGRSPWREDA